MKKSLNKTIAALIFLTLCVVGLTSLADATTTCERTDCNITITINMVAVGGNQQTIDNWIQDIDNVWNGPVIGNGDSPTFGECKCPVQVVVNFAGWVNDCDDQAAASYHCIEITPDYARDTAGGTHRAYMYGVSQKGGRITGWWSSNHVNQPLYLAPEPGAQGPVAYFPVVHDAAHEAGHMMGLGDNGNLMGVTWGDNAKPNQGHIDAIVENNCEGDDAKCPDECCCGDGKIDGDKGEECDPNADPTGCNEDESCIDCECFFTGFCGDGHISTDGGEECDPGADPNGCMIGETCDAENCICEMESDLTVAITSPTGTEPISISEPTTIEVSATSSLGVDKVEFLVDGILQSTDTLAPYEWEFDPLSYPPLLTIHTITATAYETTSGLTASDTIEVSTESPTP